MITAMQELIKRVLRNGQYIPIELQEEIIDTNLIYNNHHLTTVESHTYFSLPEKYQFDFSFLLNLSYFFIYKLTLEVRDKIQDLTIFKKSKF